MRIEQLTQAVMVAKTGSMSLAAENLYLSQPNLSIAIKHLEDELGYKVFIRNNRGVQLTPLGRIFIRSAENVLEQFNQLATSKRIEGSNEIRVLSVATMPYRYLTNVGVQLYERHKDAPFHLTLQSGSRDDIINYVYKDECEIGVLSVYSHYFDKTIHNLASKGIRFTRLGEHPICILVGKKSPIYNFNGTTISRDMLEGKCFVGFSELEYGIYASLPEILGLGQAHCPQRIYASTWNLILDIISNTDSFTIVATNSKAYAAVPYYSDLKSFQLSDCDQTCVLGWIIKEGREMSPLVKEYLDILSKYFD